MEQGVFAPEYASSYPILARLRSEGFTLRLTPERPPLIDVGPPALLRARRAYIAAQVAADRDALLLELLSEEAVATALLVGVAAEYGFVPQRGPKGEQPAWPPPLIQAPLFDEPPPARAAPSALDPQSRKKEIR